MRSLKDDLILSYVPRWVIVPMLRQQTVADHSWRVAIIATHLASRIGMAGDVMNAIALVAIGHDLDETTTGDIPATQKEVPDFDHMAPEDLVIKVADYLEQISWAEAWAHPSAKGDVVARTRIRMEGALEALDNWCGGSREVASALLAELT